MPRGPLELLAQRRLPGYLPFAEQRSDRPRPTCAEVGLRHRRPPRRLRVGRQSGEQGEQRRRVWRLRTVGGLPRYGPGELGDQRRPLPLVPDLPGELQGAPKPASVTPRAGQRQPSRVALLEREVVSEGRQGVEHPAPALCVGHVASARQDDREDPCLLLGPQGPDAPKDLLVGPSGQIPGQQLGEQRRVQLRALQRRGGGERRSGVPSLELSSGDARTQGVGALPAGRQASPRPLGQVDQAPVDRGAAQQADGDGEVWLLPSEVIEGRAEQRAGPGGRQRS